MVNTKNTTTVSFVDQPCERCGSKKLVSKTTKVDMSTAFGTTVLEVSQITCSNAACQAEFDKNRSEELKKIASRKSLKEEQDKIRKENNAIAALKRKQELLDK